MITAFPTFAMRLRNSPDATFFSIKIILVMMQETVKAGANKIILKTREELEGCIYAAVRTIIPELANYKSPAEEAADALTLEAAINFLEGLGYPTTPSNLYNLAYYKRIPYKKVRRRLLFSRKELTVWVQNQIEDPAKRHREAAEAIAESANRK